MERAINPAHNPRHALDRHHGRQHPASHRYSVLRRRSHSPGRVGAEWMVDEEDPRPVRQPAVHLHAVMVHLGRIAVLVLAFDQPLRAGHRKVAGDGRVVGDHVHVRLHPDIGRHRRADAVGAPGGLGAAMDLVDLHDRGFRVIQCGSGLDVLSVEGAREPQIAEVR